MKHEYDHIADFLEDASFVTFVYRQDPEAIRFWHAWQAAHPDKAELLESAVAIVKGIQFVTPEMSHHKVQEELAKLHARIEEREEKQPVVFGMQRFSRRMALQLVAGLGLLLLVGFAIQQLNQPIMISHRTDFGDRVEMNLPDGTHVTLNANSTLRYEKDKPRKVWLEGEAFFKVAKKPQTRERFLVITNDLTVHVCGTEFNVNSRKQQTQVVLEEGRVRLALQNGTEQEMVPGDLLTYSAAKNKVVESKRLLSAEALTSWKDGTLIFEDIRVEDALEKIAELYGYEIVFEDVRIADKLIHLTIPTKNLEICLNMMELSGGITIRRKDRLLIVK